MVAQSWALLRRGCPSRPRDPRLAARSGHRKVHAHFFSIEYAWRSWYRLEGNHRFMNVLPHKSCQTMQHHHELYVPYFCRLEWFLFNGRQRHLSHACLFGRTGDIPCC
jgi:hypothetical protein